MTIEDGSIEIEPPALLGFSNSFLGFRTSFLIGQFYPDSIHLIRQNRFFDFIQATHDFLSDIIDVVEHRIELDERLSVIRIKMFVESMFFEQ